jgi:hypothetical protein
VRKPGANGFLAPTAKELEIVGEAPSAARARGERIIATRIELPRKKVLLLFVCCTLFV